MNLPVPSVRFAYVETPLGRMLLGARGDALVGAWFEGQKYFPESGAGAEILAASDDPLFARARTQLQEYFSGVRREFDLPFAPEGSAHQRQVWAAIAQVPFGQTRGYGQVAEAIGRPKASRAVGAATGRNPLSVFIPCHRLVGGAGALTGYAGGLPRKQALLALEGVPVDGARIRRT
ncbi:methylated-DNA--[protein]-cysteine S-methyltransferase [Niveibacterium sp. SC-1]|uniref:methylated-DNA--[protein]-cysteine S-methyltransferase n=1 Tax=Niveibacterium sp. SC-1 TaxID=3135646 RepID=UPI00311DA446